MLQLGIRLRAWTGAYYGLTHGFHDWREFERKSETIEFTERQPHSIGRIIAFDTLAENSLSMEADELQLEVLLYYKYASLNAEECQSLAQWFEHESCIGLTGRVRVALDGINIILKGKKSALEHHMKLVRSHKSLEGLDIDFKLAKASSKESSLVTTQTKFDGLTIRICKELVTLGPMAELTSLSNTGIHLAPSEFHEALLEASSKGVAVLLDARNLYETRLGHFEVSGVTSIDPRTRQFSELPSFILKQKDLFRGQKVFMCCTGGVRCERSSAFLKENVPGCEVYQLKGGIQRYLEAFGSNGLFKGKNFVYDERMGVSSESGQESIVGSCSSCSLPWDDYSSRTRCQTCRMLVLICDSCLKSEGSVSEKKGFLCEICEEKMEHRRPDSSPSTEVSTSASMWNSNHPGPRKESGITRLTHGCASICHPQGQDKRPQLKILCLHGFRQTAGSLLGRTIGLRRRVTMEIDWLFVDAPHMLAPPPSNSAPPPSSSAPPPSSSAPPPEAAARRCWKLECVDENQQGLTESLSRIQAFVDQHGPFDGVMGFSEGAAMASILCRMQKEGRLRFGFRFCILASGYVPRIGHPSSSPIDLPSLHIFGGRGEANQEADDQVPASESEKLLESFTDSIRRRVFRHGSGHLIPCTKQVVACFQSFLEDQLT